MRKFFAKSSVIEIVQEFEDTQDCLVQMNGKTYSRFLIKMDLIERFYEEIVEEKTYD